MFKKQKCEGCRKPKYFVKSREIDLGGSIGIAKSIPKLCWSCGRKIKRFAKQWSKNG